MTVLTISLRISLNDTDKHTVRTNRWPAIDGDR